MTHRSYKFFLRPTATQHEHLDRIRQTCCELYNAALQEKRDAYRYAGLNRSAAAQSRELTEVKTLRPDVAGVYGQVLQDVLRRLHRAFDGFYRRVAAGATPGYPRFRSARRYDSFTFPQVGRKGALHGCGVDLLSNGRLRVHGVPGELKVVWHRAVVGTVKTATFKREGDRWYVVFACNDVPLEGSPATGRTCGLDVGLASFAVLDDGAAVANPRLLRQAERRLAAKQRVLARRERGSKRRADARKRVAACHARVANARRDHAHKAARMLVTFYDRIAVERLNVAGLARGFLSKSVHDAGWGGFLAILASKAANAGRELVAVDPAHTTSDCSGCGARVPKLLRERVHRCDRCGLVMDRDQNAARNIRYRAFGREAAVGEGLSRPDEPRSPAP